MQSSTRDHKVYFVKVDYYSFPKKKITIFETCEINQQDVTSEVLVTAVDVKCNFTQQKIAD